MKMIQGVEDKMQNLLESYDQKLGAIQEKIDEKSEYRAEALQRLRRKSDYMKDIMEKSYL